MRIPRIIFMLLIAAACCPVNVLAHWMTFTGGPVVAIGTWPAGAALNGTATVTASNFVNGNNATGPIGLTPISINNLSSDYFATGLIPNPGPVVDAIATPYNDAADTYHVVVDFTGTIGGSNPGTLPAGSTFAIIDNDINEDYRNIRATNSLNLPITSAWIFGPWGYFDMTNPMIPQGSLVPNPTITGPILGVYQMFGVSYNFDVGMWLFKVTQDVKTIEFDMQKSTGGNAIGGGGAGWAFYSRAIPEPATASVCVVAAGFAVFSCRRLLRPSG